MDQVTLIVTNVLQPGKAAFAVREDTGEQVYIPAAVSKACGLEPTHIVKGKLVPNRQNTKDVPWMAPIILPSEESIETPETVYKALDAFDYPVTAEEAGVSLFSLQNAHQEGMAVKLIVKAKPDDKAVLYWAATMDKV